MLLLRLCRTAARLDPRIFPGRWFHRRGLAALAAGDPARADRWFEAAAACYRRELAVAPLARLRVHQLMASARGGPPGAESAAVVNLVRRLNRLDRLEQLRAPFDLADARAVLGDWLEQGERARPDTSPEAPSGLQAA